MSSKQAEFAYWNKHESWTNYATWLAYTDMIRGYVNTLHEEVANGDIWPFENVEELAGAFSEHVEEMVFLDGRDNSLAHNYALAFIEEIDYLSLATLTAKNCEGLID